MKNFFLLLVLFFSTTLVYAQNKSLGVGTATPNPNAALDVSSPTNNQGALMPRLTTGQRTAMTGILGAADAGLLLYDIDEKTLYIWNGTAWESSSKVRYPQVDTISTLPPNGNALRLVYNGTDIGNFGVAHFENMNPNAGFSAIFGRTNSATNGAADFMVSNPANTNDAVGVTTNALNGRAGAFSLNNAGSRNYALYAQSNGDSTGAAVHGNNVGNGFGVFGKSAGSKFASAAVYGEHVGTGDAAGAFRINNVGNTYSALYGETNGSGSAIFGNQLGTGRAGQFQIGNATSTSAALRGFTNGLGYAGFFTINNASSTVSAVYGETNGALTSAAVYGLNTGNGFGVVGRANGSAFGSAAVYGEQLGTGDAAGAFRINNVANTSNAVYGETNGTASAINANQLGTGRGMIAQINNAGNAQSAFLAQTNGTGPAIVANQSNGGLAVDITAGGIKNSFVTESTPGEITAKTGIVNITTAGTYTLSTAGRVNGETIIVTSEVALDTVDIDLGGGWLVRFTDVNQAATLVFINGNWRGTGAIQP